MKRRVKFDCFIRIGFILLFFISLYWIWAGIAAAQVITRGCY